MEYIYILNFDCIQNFEIARYIIYFRVLCVSKIYYDRIKAITKCNFDTEDKGKQVCQMHIVPNLTFLDVQGKTPDNEINFNIYQQAYFRIYSKIVPLKILTINNVEFLFEHESLTNLIHLNIKKFRYLALNLII